AGRSALDRLPCARSEADPAGALPRPPPPAEGLYRAHDSPPPHPSLHSADHRREPVDTLRPAAPAGHLATGRHTGGNATVTAFDDLLVVQDHDTAVEQLRHGRATLPERARLEA